MKDAEFKEFKLSLPKIKRRLKTLSDDTEKKIKKKDGFTALQLCEIVYKYKMILEFDPFLICFLQSANDFPALLESKTESTASVLLGLPDKFLQHLLPHLNTKQAVTFFNRCKSAKLLQLLGVYSKLNTGFLDEIIKNPLKYKTYLLFELLLEFDRSVVATKINRNASLWGKAIEAVINDNKTQVDRYGLGETTQIDCSVLTPFLKFEISSLSCITALMIKKHKSHWDHTGIIGLLVEVDSHSVDVDFQRVMPELGLRAAKDSIALYDGVKKINSEFKGREVTLFECKENDESAPAFKRFLQHCKLLSQAASATSPLSPLAVKSLFSASPESELRLKYEALRDELIKKSDEFESVHEADTNPKSGHMLTGYDRERLQQSGRQAPK